MSMWPEPVIEDVLLPDGRRWEHVRRVSRRIDLADELGIEIDSLGFFQFDPHQTSGFFVLRSPDGRAQCVMKIDFGSFDEVRGRYGRPGTPEEIRLAEEVAPAFGRQILRDAGYAVDEYEAIEASQP